MGTTTKHMDVLVIGAGLGGLSTTMFLAQQGAEVLAVERHPGTSIHPRASGQNWRTMELFRFAGIDQRLLSASGRASQGLRITIAASVGGPVLHQIVEDVADIDVAAATPAPHGMAGQDIAEPVMLARAEELGAEVRFSCELVSFTQHQDEVRAEVRDRRTGEIAPIAARYLVAADGARSPIREQLGIRTEGQGAIGHSIGVVFDADMSDRLLPEVTELFYLQNPDFTAAFCNTDIPGRFVFAPDYHPERGERAEDFTRQRLTEMIRTATDLPDLEPEIRWTGPWEMAARVATRFREGRVFLVGDAAKVTPPTGGMGGNTAVGDGHDLAWKLAAVLRGEAGDGLLDTYQDERRPISEMVVTTSLHNAKQRMLPELDLTGLPAPEEPLALTLGFRYRSSAVLPDDTDDNDTKPAGARTENPLEPTGRPGFRAPHVPITVDGVLKSTIDFFGRGWVLLAAGDAHVWHDAAASCAEKLSLSLDCQVLGTDFADSAGLFASRYGLGAGGATLIRPDGVVAWRHRDGGARATQALLNAFGHVLSR